MSHFAEGERVYLRPFLGSDIAIWHNWFNDPVVTEHMNKGMFPNTEDMQAEHFQQISRSRKDIQLAVVAKEGDILVGSVGIHNIDWTHRTGDVSIVVGDRRQWGKGLASEAVSLIVRHAFGKLNLRRLSAGMSEVNVGSRRCFEKNGFSQEGTKRKSFFYQDRYVDMHLFGLLRSEWEAKGKG